MNILITGQNGFVGRYLVAKLKTMNCDKVFYFPSFVDFRNQLNNCAIMDSEGALVDGDVKIDAVVHLAAKLMINNHRAVQYFNTNAIGTFNILEYCRVKKIPKLVYAMTHSDQNNHASDFVDEANFSDFTTNSFENNAIPFIASKIAGANMVEAYTKTGILNGVILRFANIRGVGSSDTKFDSPFHQFIRKARNGEPIEIWGNPAKTRRDMIYVKDVVDAIIKSVECQKVKGTFNIGSGVGLTIAEEIQTIREVFCDPWNMSELIYRTDIPEVRTKTSIFKINRAKMVLGWEPKYSYKQALQDMKEIMYGRNK